MKEYCFKLLNKMDLQGKYLPPFGEECDRNSGRKVMEQGCGYFVEVK